MVKRAIDMEGTATGEHGVGLVKRDYLPEELGQDTVDLMRKVRVLFLDLPKLLVPSSLIFPFFLIVSFLHADFETLLPCWLV